MKEINISGKAQPATQMALDTRAVDVFQQIAMIPTSQIITGS